MIATTVRVIAASTIAALLALFVVAPGIEQLTRTAHATPSSIGFIAIVSNETDDALVADIIVNDVDPSGESPVRVYIDIAVGDPDRAEIPVTTQVWDANGERVNSTEEAVDPRMGAGVSVVLGGALASALLECNDPLVNITQEPYEDLTDAETQAVVKALQGGDLGATVTGSDASTRAWEAASHLGFRVLRPQWLFAGGVEERVGDAAAAVSFSARWNHWSCTFEPSAFIESAGATSVVNFPRVTGFVGRHSDEPASIEFRRTLTVDDSENVSAASLSGGAHRDKAGMVRSEATERTMNSHSPSVGVESVTLEFTDLARSRDRDRAILFAGIAAGVAATLILMALKQLAPVPAWLYSRVRSVARRGGDL